jgi:hypothetical protein
VCLNCGVMTISHSVTGATQCAATCDEGQCCCGAGVFLSSDGKSCTPCRAGSYKSGTGLGKCTPCADYTVAVESGSATCTTCDYSGGGVIPVGYGWTGTMCNIPCPRGSYKSNIGPGICKLCNSSCTCPPGKVPIADGTGCAEYSSQLASEGCSVLASEGCSLCLPSCTCPLGRVATADGTGCLVPGITFVTAKISQIGLSCDAVCGETDGKGNGVASGEGVGCAKEGFLTDWSQDLLQNLIAPAGELWFFKFYYATPASSAPYVYLDDNLRYPSDGGTSSTCAASRESVARICPCGPCPSGTVSPTGDRSPCQM